MYTDAVQLDGDEVPEGILDALVTAAAARHDLAPAGRRNSKVCRSKARLAYRAVRLQCVETGLRVGYVWATRGLRVGKARAAHGGDC